MANLLDLDAVGAGGRCESLGSRFAEQVVVPLSCVVLDGVLVCEHVDR
jgi:hypothetical protein